MRLAEDGEARCLCRDPQASLLARALLPAAEHQALEGRPDAEAEMVVAGVRAAFMDRFVLDALGRRIRQVVLVGSGMDSRAYRMDVPPQLTFTEIDAGPILEAKDYVLGLGGERARCTVRHAALDFVADAEAAGRIGSVIAPALSASRGSGVLFLLDAALDAWPGNVQTAVLGAIAEAAPDGSTIVGPPPSEDAMEALNVGGFGKTSMINHLQLSKIFGLTAPDLAVPEGTTMLVAMRGQQQGPRRPAAEPLGSVGGGRGREVKF